MIRDEGEDGLTRLDATKIYHHFLRRKANGEVFDWTQITSEDLRRLSWDYDLSDAWIGEIYGISKRQVMARRTQWGLQLYRRMEPRSTLKLAKVLDEVFEERLHAAEAVARTPYESHFPGSNGRVWYLALEDGRLRITRKVDGSPEVEWTCDTPDYARSLMQQIGGDAVPEAAASADEGTIISPLLDDRETAWLEGSIRTALALWH